jgi:DNA-binding transcriptional LysR family regulator
MRSSLPESDVPYWPERENSCARPNCCEHMHMRWRETFTRKKESFAPPSEPNGRIELGYAPAPTAAIIAGILSRYHELAPRASVTLHDLSLSEILTALKAKRLRAGLTIRPRSGPLAQLSVIRPSEVPMNKLIGYQAVEFPEYHQWVAKVLGVSKTCVTISQECDGVLSVIAAVEAGHAPAVVGEFTTAVAGNRVRFIPFASKASYMERQITIPDHFTQPNVPY